MANSKIYGKLPQKCNSMLAECKAIASAIDKHQLTILDGKLTPVNSYTPGNGNTSQATIKAKNGKIIYGTLNTDTGTFVRGVKPVSLTNSIPPISFQNLSSSKLSTIFTKNIQQTITNTLKTYSKLFNIDLSSLDVGVIDDKTMDKLRGSGTAAFQTNNGIILRQSFDFNNPVDVATLKHELFHAVQRTGKEPTLDALEKNPKLKNPGFSAPLWLTEGSAVLATKTELRQACGNNYNQPVCFQVNAKSDSSPILDCKQNPPSDNCSILTNICKSDPKSSACSDLKNNALSFQTMSANTSNIKYSAGSSFLEYLNNKAPNSFATVFDLSYRQPYNDKVWEKVYGKSVEVMWNEFIDDTKSGIFNVETGVYNNQPHDDFR